MSIDVSCEGTAWSDDAHDEWVNMSNANAADVLAALGIDFLEASQSGMTLDAEDVVGRCLLALAVAPEDEGFETYEMVADEVHANPILDALCGGDGGPRVYRGGRRPGYLQERLRAIQTVAETARARGVRVFIS